jgi:excisionase family DNA binding protein
MEGRIKVVTEARMEPETLAYTVPEAARILSIGPGKLREMIAKGEIEEVRIGGAVRVRRATLDAFLRERSRPRGGQPCPDTAPTEPDTPPPPKPIRRPSTEEEEVFGPRRSRAASTGRARRGDSR